MTGRKSLHQLRLAGINYNYSTVHRSASRSLPKAEKQTALEAFGFVPQAISDSTKQIDVKSDQPKLTSKRKKLEHKTNFEDDTDGEWLPPLRTTSKNTPGIKTRGKVPIANDIIVQEGHKRTTLPTNTAEEEGTKWRFADDYEVAETQFAQPWSPQSQQGNDPIRTATPLTPNSTRHSRRTDQMLLPPITPRRTKLKEIPSSNSPPITPFTPYMSHDSPLRQPLDSPLIARVTGFGGPRAVKPEQELVVSSQWWENEEIIALSTQGAPEDPYLRFDGDTIEADEGAPVQRTLFKQSISLVSPNSRSISSVVNHHEDHQDYALAEDQNLDDDAADLPDGVIIANKNKMHNSEYQNLTPEQRKPDRIRSASPFETPWKSNQEDQRNSEKCNIWPQLDSEHDLPSSPPHIKAQASHPYPCEVTGETQYEGCDISYHYWGTAADHQGSPIYGEKGKGREREKQVNKEENQGKEKHSQENDYVDEEGEVTMSQLLPETLMESFPIPPPLSQFSSTPNDIFSKF